MHTQANMPAELIYDITDALASFVSLSRCILLSVISAYGNL